jgi:hypothetical protein
MKIKIKSENPFDMNLFMNSPFLCELRGKQKVNFASLLNPFAHSPLLSADSAVKTYGRNPCGR